MSQENVAVVRRMFEAFNQRDFEASLACFAGDASWHDGAAMAGGGVHQGREEIASGVQRWLDAWAELRIDIEELIEVGDHVVVFARMRGAGRSSGADVEMRPAFVCEVLDGKVVSGRGFGDRTDALEAVGLPPEPPSQGDTEEARKAFEAELREGDVYRRRIS